MGELVSNKSDIIKTVFNQYDQEGKEEITPIQVQMLYGDLRMGSLSLPQVGIAFLNIVMFFWLSEYFIMLIFSLFTNNKG